MEKLLWAALSAFNEIPNKSLRNNREGFKDTYSIASAIGANLTSSTDLLEAVADIAVLAGLYQYRPANSADITSNCIEWAKEFVALHEKTKWGVDKEYAETLADFALTKMQGFIK